MKRIIYILFFVSCFASAQQTHSNRTELAEEIFNGFYTNAQKRGIEVRNRLYSINKILFLPGANDDHIHTNGICTITIGLAKYESDWDIMRKTYHEIGHHFGLNDCEKCTYNIMSKFQDSVSVRLFKNAPVRQLYIDIFFEAIRNPKKYNDGHTHY